MVLVFDTATDGIAIPSPSQITLPRYLLLCEDLKSTRQDLAITRWLTSILYPKQFPDNLQETTRQFYKLFYQVDLTDEQVAMLLTTATSKWER